jgi:hypothetical protein
MQIVGERELIDKTLILRIFEDWLIRLIFMEPSLLIEIVDSEYSSGT